MDHGVPGCGDGVLGCHFVAAHCFCVQLAQGILFRLLPWWWGAHWRWQSFFLEPLVLDLEVILACPLFQQQAFDLSRKPGPAPPFWRWGEAQPDVSCLAIGCHCFGCEVGLPYRLNC